MSDNNAPARTPEGRFPKGVSGNKSGRPVGAKNKITLLRQSLELQLREQAAPDLPGVLNKAVELALTGDQAMIKLLLELHMSKGTTDTHEAKDKVEINITGGSPVVNQVSVIDVEEADYEQTSTSTERSGDFDEGQEAETV